MISPLRVGDSVRVDDADFESGAVWEVVKLHEPGPHTAAVPTATIRHLQRPTTVEYVDIDRLDRVRRIAE